MSRYSKRKTCLRLFSGPIGVVTALLLFIAALSVISLFLFASTLNRIERELADSPASIAADSRLPTVTVLTTVVNVDEFIQGFFEDIIDQSYFPHCQLLVLHIGNMTSPLVANVTSKYASLYPKQIQNVFLPRVDLYEGWNLAIQEHSRGNYITIANPDDRRHPRAIEKLVRFLEANSHYDVVSSSTRVTSVPNLRWADTYSDPDAKTWWETPDGFEVRELHMFTWDRFGRLRDSMNLPHSGPLWRRSLHLQVGYFDSFFDPAADWEFWLRSLTLNSRIWLLGGAPLNVYYLNPRSYGRGNAALAQRNTLRHTLTREVLRQYHRYVTCRRLRVLVAFEPASAARWAVAGLTDDPLAAQSHPLAAPRVGQLLKWLSDEGTDVVVLAPPPVPAPLARLLQLTGAHVVSSLANVTGMVDAAVLHVDFAAKAPENVTGAAGVSQAEWLAGAVAARWPWAVRVLLTDAVHYVRDEWEPVCGPGCSLESREVSLWSKAHLVLAPTAADGSGIERRAPDTLVDVFPFVAPPARTLGPPFDERRALLYVASHTERNAAGLAWFMQYVWPGLSRDLPHAPLVLAGASEWQRFETADGRVRSVAALDSAALRSARVLLQAEAPSARPPAAGQDLRESWRDTGISSDALVAVAHALPAVLSPVAARGLCCADHQDEAPCGGDAPLVARSARDFAERIERLYLNGTAWQATRAALLDLTRTCLSADSQYRDGYFLGMLRSLAQTHCSPAPNATQGTEVPWYIYKEEFHNHWQRLAKTRPRS